MYVYDVIRLFNVLPDNQGLAIGVGVIFRTV
jgi:hypothetical protein